MPKRRTCRSGACSIVVSAYWQTPVPLQKLVHVPPTPQQSELDVQVALQIDSLEPQIGPDSWTFTSTHARPSSQSAFVSHGNLKLSLSSSLHAMSRPSSSTNELEQRRLTALFDRGLLDLVETKLTVFTALEIDDIEQRL